jgi:hypothetical protein
MTEFEVSVFFGARNQLRYLAGDYNSRGSHFAPSGVERMVGVWNFHLARHTLDAFAVPMACRGRQFKLGSVCYNSRCCPILRVACAQGACIKQDLRCTYEQIGPR